MMSDAVRFLVAISAVALVGCSSNNSGGTSGTGGHSGGSQGNGGASVSSGGSGGSGGSVGTGGTIGSGGTVGSGGTLGSGGNTDRGGNTGSGDNPANGGSPTGGVADSGGAGGAGGHGGTSAVSDAGASHDATTAIDASADVGLLPASMVTGLSFAPVTGPDINPPPPVYVVVADVGRAQDAYSATLALPAGVTRFSCPIDFGVLYQLAFSFSDGSSLTVTLDPGGCEGVQMPGSISRTALSGSDYWYELTQDLGIPEADIYPYVAPGFQSNDQDPQQPFKTCTTDTDCDADYRCGYVVADGCTATGVCMASACTGANCAAGAPEICGCEGQTILPVWSQSSATAVVVVYASAPASGRLGPCTGSGDAGGMD